jgi:hypothetical protein
MAHETTIAPKNVWEKLLIFWRTKNHSSRIYDIALILAVAIYTNKRIYEEELREARRQLSGCVESQEEVENIMEYIEMKLDAYRGDAELWHRDQRKVRDLVGKDEELYAYLLSIFEADDSIDDEESGFESSLKKMLLRS